MVKRKVLLLVLAASWLIIMALTGCGTLDINFHTTIKTSGDITQEIKLEGSGMLGSMLEEIEDIENLESEGWQVTTRRTDDSTAIIITRDFDQNEPVIFDDEPISIRRRFSSHITDNIFIKTYYYELNLPGGAPIGAGNGGDESDELGEMMLEGMFNLSWTFTLPGKITESNADLIEGDSATWYFDIDSLQSDRYFMVQSRYINWPLIIGITSGVLIIIGLAIFLILRARKRRIQALYSVE